MGGVIKVLVRKHPGQPIKNSNQMASPSLRVVLPGTNCKQMQHGCANMLAVEPLCGMVGGKLIQHLCELRGPDFPPT